MKLEIKHIKNYLGTKVTMIQKEDFHSNDWTEYRESVLCQLADENNPDFFYIGTINDKHFSCYESNQFKLALRPISDLTTNITINGESFMPTCWLRDNHFQFNVTKEDMEQLIKMFLHIFTSYESAPAWFLNKLYEWHFDIHGLIKYGLAINIKDLKPCTSQST
jgi:hypothetical protein